MLTPPLPTGLEPVPSLPQAARLESTINARSFRKMSHRTLASEKKGGLTECAHPVGKSISANVPFSSHRRAAL